MFIIYFHSLMCIGWFQLLYLILFIILFEYCINMCKKLKAKLFLCAQHEDIQGLEK